MRAAAVLVDYPPNRFIGAELATHALLRTLQGAGWDVRVLTHAPPPPGTASYDGIPLRPLRRITASSVSEGGYPGSGDSVLITHTYISPELASPLLDARARHGTPIVLYAHHARDHARRAIGLLEPDIVLPNSLATARALSLPPALTVRPPLPLPSPRDLAARILAAPRPPTAGYINSAAMKGGLLLRALSVLPSRTYPLFGVGGGYGEQLLPGRRPVPHADMPEEYYSKIGVHLQLSQSESYGLSALEALSHGVPVISTDLPGPREALAGIPPPYVQWLPASAAGAAAEHLDALIRRALSARPPTARQARALAAALSRASAAADDDRLRAEQFLRDRCALA